MITEFKLFEKFNIGKPKIGDYCICVDGDDKHPKIGDFVDVNIGRLEDMAIIGGEMNYSIIYENIPDDIRNWFSRYGCRLFFKENIKYWSNNKKELEDILMANKYNI